MRQIATFTSKGGIGVKADNGEFLWRYTKVANSTANVTTPVYRDGQLYYTSGYGTGCALLKLSGDGAADEVYFNKDMQNHHGGVVLIGPYIYGFDRERLVCMRFDDGKVMWMNRSVGKGSVSYADGHLYVLSENGRMALVEATHTEYVEKGQFNIPDRSSERSWAHPVVANGKLYIRDQEMLLCYDVDQ